MNKNRMSDSEDMCPTCGKMCVFKWQQFKDETLHIRQECLDHGYIKYVRKVEPYITLANAHVIDEQYTSSQSSITDFIGEQ